VPWLLLSVGSHCGSHVRAVFGNPGGCILANPYDSQDDEAVPDGGGDSLVVASILGLTLPMTDDLVLNVICRSLV
jgi:hypothetical protein